MRPASERATWLDINLDQVRQNTRAVKNLVGDACEVLAVVKADGYGLGATFMARAALAGGASWLGVACVDEGIALRLAGIQAPVLVMGYASPDEASSAVRFGLTLCVHRAQTVRALEEAASKLGSPPRSVAVHVEIDTGLGRFGVMPWEFLALAREIEGCPRLRLQGVMTHFAEADAPDLTYSHEQLARFEHLLDEARRSGIKPEIVHAPNSAGTIALPESRYNLVRIGLLLSGHYPSAALSEARLVAPAVTWRARLARVFQVEPGSTIGYGRTWRATRSSTVGLVPVGYADGYRRAFSNRGWVLVRGRRCPVIGRVSMDQFTVDLTAVPDADEGDEAVLLGEQGTDVVTADDLASWADTIPYEILTGLSRRVPRHYLRGGRQVGSCDLFGCEDEMLADEAENESR